MMIQFLLALAVATLFAILVTLRSMLRIMRRNDKAPKLAEAIMKEARKMPGMTFDPVSNTYRTRRV